MATAHGDLLWKPSAARLDAAAITKFRHWINQQYDLELCDYHELWQWSVENISTFWTAIASYYGAIDESQLQPALADAAMPGATWFPNARLNFSEYLLSQGDANAVAVFADSEAVGEKQLTWDELRTQVKALAHSLREAGVGEGDHVCAYLPISCESVVALLATTAVGAVWSSCSPDFGCESVLERFSQVAPKVLFSVCEYRYGGKHHDRSDDVQRLISELPSLQRVVSLPWPDEDKPQQLRMNPGCEHMGWSTACSAACQSLEFDFAAVPFSHPLWVLYTSGTTGLPKGIVHGHGGALLEFLKSSHLHDNLNEKSVKFFFTTTGWTMFNLLVGGLVTGGAIVVYDGNPGWPGPGKLFELAARYSVSYFGASPTYVNGLMGQDYQPQQGLDLSRIETVSLTGSPASPENFAWFYENLHRDLHVFSMSGGTDVVAAFVGGVPTLPVHAGLIQAPLLAVDVCAIDENGSTLIDEDGEMVIRQPMPSMPLHLLHDPDFVRYRESYFDQFEGHWRQGDLIRFDKDGRCVITGRSDSTLNRYGVRIGTAEIYRTVEALEGVADSLIVNLELPGAQFYMPLFVSLVTGVELSDDLKSQIALKLKTKCSPRHVPDEIHAVDEIPYTLSGKKMEIPVKKLLMGTPMHEAANRDACRNPRALDFYSEFKVPRDIA